jgi:hypothetical protein
MVSGYEHKCGVTNIHRVEIFCIGSRGIAGEFVSVSQVIFTPIVVFIKKIGPHPTLPLTMSKTKASPGASNHKP